MKNIYKLSTGKEITVSSTNKGTSNALLGDTHYRYLIKFVVGDISVSFTFHDSIYNYRKGITANKQMIDSAVDCIISDGFAFANNSKLANFLIEYGYDDYNYTEGKKCYNGCMDTWYKLLKIMSEEEISELFEIINESWN